MDENIDLEKVRKVAEGDLPLSTVAEVIMDELTR